MHDRGVLYSDLQASNIVRLPDNTLKLIDLVDVVKMQCKRRKKSRTIRRLQPKTFCHHVTHWAKVLELM